MTAPSWVRAPRAAAPAPPPPSPAPPAGPPVRRRVRPAIEAPPPWRPAEVGPDRCPACLAVPLAGCAACGAPAVAATAAGDPEGRHSISWCAGCLGRLHAARAGVANAPLAFVPFPTAAQRRALAERARAREGRRRAARAAKAARLA